MNLKYLSVCSGVEAATQAWHPLGWQPWAFAEIEPFPAHVLAHHYGSGRPWHMPDPAEPGLSADDVKARRADIKAVAKMPEVGFGGNGVPNLGDMTKFKEWPDAVFDVLVGGTPCQSFSVAGLREGLDDPRGNLMLTYVAIARRYRPKICVWENVPGVLSDDEGRSFGTLLGLLTGQRVEVPAGGWRSAGVVDGYKGAYGVAWRIVDTQYCRVDGFGRAIPQRRRRVFVVGYLGDWRRAAAILFELESLSGNPPPRRSPGQGVAGAVAASSARRGGVTEGERGGLIPESSPPIRAGGVGAGGMHGLDADTVDALVPVAGTHDNGGGQVAVAFQPRFARNGRGAPDVVAAPLTAEAGRTGKGDSAQCVAVDMRNGTVGDVAQTVQAAGLGAERGGNPNAIPHVLAIQERAVCENPEAGPDGVGIRDDGAAYTMEARSLPQAVAFGLRSDAAREGVAKTPSTDANGVVRLRDPGFSVYQGLAPTLDSGAPHSVATSWAVRRLIPVECERLQGMVDGYTNVPWRGADGAPDGPRYRSLGNSMSINVMRWLGFRIEMILQISENKN